MKGIINLALCALLAGCATTEGVAPIELTKPAKLTSFTLKSDGIGEMVSTNAFGSKTTYSVGLRQGKYVSVFVDKDGTYYEGPKDCLYNSLAYSKYLDGGIWLPNKGSKDEPRFWSYLKPLEPDLESKAGILVAALANMSAGNVKKEWSTKIEPFLLNQISIEDEIQSSTPANAAATPPVVVAAAVALSSSVFVGTWDGKWAGVRDHTLVVESGEGMSVRLNFTWGPGKQPEFRDSGTYSVVGTVGDDGTLRAVLADGSKVAYTMSEDRRSLSGKWERKQRTLEGAFSRRGTP
jgi:hypothetical protein